jgi:transposase
MSRYRLYPAPDQAVLLARYCGHARYVYNLAVEQLGYSTRDRRMPRFAEQSRQLTEARHENPWMTEIPTVVGQQALRDFNQAMTNWYSGTHRRPSWRKRGWREGFRVTAGNGLRFEQINRRWSRVWIPRLGWVKFRRTRPVGDAKSFRVTLDGAGRWHIAFAAIPEPIVGPCDGSVVGIDRGVAVTLALSDGATHQAPAPLPIKLAAQALSRCRHGSNRRQVAKARLARLHARNADRRKDWAEKASTDIASRYDTIRIEDLRVLNMVRSARGTRVKPGHNVRQKAGLNRSILSAGWTLFAQRLEHKAAGRVEQINPAFTSQRCSTCGHVDRNSRESQSLFRCTACAYAVNADLNAAKNIAAGHAVRGAETSSALRREPQHAAALVA